MGERFREKNLGEDLERSSDPGRAIRGITMVCAVMQKSRVSPALLLVVHLELQLQRELDLTRRRGSRLNDPA